MVEGSITSQRRLRVLSSKKGSRMAVVASGIRIMSDSLMPFQPAMEEPSNILPSSNSLSSTAWAGTVTCCSLPLVSVERKSTKRTPSLAIRSRTSLPFLMAMGELRSEGGDALYKARRVPTSPIQDWRGGHDIWFIEEIERRTKMVRARFRVATLYCGLRAGRALGPQEKPHGLKKTRYFSRAYISPSGLLV